MNSFKSLNTKKVNNTVIGNKRVSRKDDRIKNENVFGIFCKYNE